MEHPGVPVCVCVYVCAHVHACVHVSLRVPVGSQIYLKWSTLLSAAITP